MREIEIKIKIKDRKTFETLVKKFEEKLSKPIEQRDVIYSYGGDLSIMKSITPGSIVIRIRREGKVARFALKQQLSHRLDKTEYETEIKDPDALHASLLIMGYKPVVEVAKTRRKGMFGQDEICFDDVKSLGYFFEIERLSDDDADVIAVTDDLYEKIKSLGLDRGDEEKRGYDIQMYAKLYSK
ncbi:MAG: class IV adenylate cyclase [Candidatus Paceibacterota bacterium]|jgi:adenylate cyclase class 2